METGSILQSLQLSVYGLHRVSQKKYGLENYNILRMVQYQCNILRHGNYNFHLSVCNVSIQYLKVN